MKKRILYTVLLAAGLAFSSCSDQFLQDMNPYDSYSPEKTFGIESNLDLYIQNVYYNYFYKSGMTSHTACPVTGMTIQLIRRRNGVSRRNLTLPEV
jgi:hypothetical protein